MKPADLDAIAARANAAYPGPWRAGTVEAEGKVWAHDPEALGGPVVGERCVFIANKYFEHTANREFVAHARKDVPDLVAEVRRLRGLLDAETAAHRGDLRDDAKALDDLVAQVWRATGEEHEPPADVAALLRRVADDHKALVGFRRAMLDVCEAIDDVRPEPDFDAPAELGAWACDEIARRVSAARRKGAEAMREACALTAARRAETLDAAAGDDPDLDDPDVAYRYGRFVEAVDLAVALRALPLPGGEP